MEFYTEKRKKEYLIPDGIVMKSDNVTDEKELLTVFTKQNMIATKKPCVVDGKGFLVFDFGKEYYGSARILLGSCTMHSTKANIRIRFGESLSECCAELGEKNTTNDHSTRDITTYMSSNSDMEWGNTGYRYIRIDFIEDGYYKINNIFGTFIHGKEPVAKYETNNALVNQILEMSARTVFLNMQNYIWDGIKRDQHIWVGDLYPEVLGVYYLYKDTKIVGDTLDAVIDNYVLPSWFNDIPSYNIWFVLVAGLQYKHTGKKNERYCEAVYNILRQFDECIDESGTFDFDKVNLPYWTGDYFDWPTFSSTQDSRLGVYYLLYFALLDIVEKDCYNKKIKAFAQGMIGKLDKRVVGDSNFKSIEALKVLCKKGDAKKAISFIKEGGAKGYSSFLSYIISKALCEHQETQAAFDNLVEYYGGMLEMGATTCWESFDVEWMNNACKITELPKEGQVDIHGDKGADCYQGFRHSLCHGWSCGFLPFFVENVVGFHYTNKECTQIAFTPNLCGLNHVKAKIPTAKGMVEVEHRLVNGKIETSCILPNGLKKI